MSVFQMELNDYPHFNLAEDGRLCSTGQHCPGFLRLLYDALIRLGYDGDAPVYRCRLSRVHDWDRCEVSVTIPFDPTRPWSESVIGSEPDIGIEMMSHIALTSLCEDHLTTTATLPIALLPIRDQENPVLGSPGLEYRWMAFPFRAKGNVLTVREIASANSDQSLKRNFGFKPLCITNT
jgi:hypothetical protein